MQADDGLTMLRWRFEAANLVRLLSGLPRRERWLVGLGAPVIALYGAGQFAGLAGHHLAAAPVAVIGGAAGMLVALLARSRAARRQEAAWLAVLPIADERRRHMAWQETLAFCALAQLALVGSAVVVLGLSSVSARWNRLGVFALASLAGQVIMLAAVLVQRDASPSLSTGHRRPVSRLALRATRLLAWPERAAPQWCGIWALDACGPRANGVEVGLAAALCLGLGIVGLCGRSPLPVVLAAVIAHLGFIALLRGRLLGEIALRSLPLGFARALWGVARAPLCLSAAPVALNAVFCLAGLPVGRAEAAGIGLAAVPGVGLADLSYLAACVASAGWQGLARANYAVLCAILAANAVRFGPSEGLLLAVGVLWMLRRGRRRFEGMGG